VRAEMTDEAMSPPGFRGTCGAPTDAWHSIERIIFRVILHLSNHCGDADETPNVGTSIVSTH
jgi:hypothetical protein